MPRRTLKPTEANPSDAKVLTAAQVNLIFAEVNVEGGHDIDPVHIGRLSNAYHERLAREAAGAPRPEFIGPLASTLLEVLFERHPELFRETSTAGAEKGA